MSLKTWYGTVVVQFHSSGESIASVGDLLQNRERTGVPKRAARLGWWMRPDAIFNCYLQFLG